MWTKINITNTKPYKSTRTAIKNDRIQVTLDMPIETYSLFRRQIEAPHSLRGRRKEDTNNGTVER